MKTKSVLRCLLFLFIPFWSFAEEAQDLPQKTVDPTASLPSIVLRNDYTSDLWQRDGERNTLSLRVINPFYVWDQHNLLSLDVPYVTGTDTNAGAGASQIVDLLIFSTSWGRFGLGYDALFLPPRSGIQGIQSGPAFGAVAVVNKCNFGALNLNFLGDGSSLSALQLIAGCSLGNGWTASTGNFIPVYDWRAEKLISLPLSLQVGKVVDISGQPVQFFLNPTYNTIDTAGMPRWNYILGLSLIANPFK